MIVGVAGPMQSGKQELRWVFEEKGFVVLDLNEIAAEARLENSRVRGEYFRQNLIQSIGLDGERTGEYFQRILIHPKAHTQIMGAELAAVIEAVPRLIEDQAGRNVVLSWGYLHLALTQLPPLDHLLLFRSEEQIWFARLKKRARDMGMTGEIDHHQLVWLLTVMGMWPRQIENMLAKPSSTRVSVVDTSADDWGAAQLRLVLSTLG